MTYASTTAALRDWPAQLNNAPISIQYDVVDSQVHNDDNKALFCTPERKERK